MPKTASLPDPSLGVLGRLTSLVIEAARMRDSRYPDVPLTRPALMNLIALSRLTLKEFGGTPLTNFAQALEYFFDDISQDELPDADVALLASITFSRLFEVLSFIDENPDFMSITARMNEIVTAAANPQGLGTWHCCATLPSLIAQFNIMEPLIGCDPHFEIVRPAIEFHAQQALAGYAVTLGDVLDEITGTLQRLSYA